MTAPSSIDPTCSASDSRVAAASGWISACVDGWHLPDSRAWPAARDAATAACSAVSASRWRPRNRLPVGGPPVAYADAEQLGERESTQ